jgi:hypothetical protein
MVALNICDVGSGTLDNPVLTAVEKSTAYFAGGCRGGIPGGILRPPTPAWLVRGATVMARASAGVDHPHSSLIMVKVHTALETNVLRLPMPHLQGEEAHTDR